MKNVGALCIAVVAAALTLALSSATGAPPDHGYEYRLPVPAGQTVTITQGAHMCAPNTTKECFWDHTGTVGDALDFGEDGDPSFSIAAAHQGVVLAAYDDSATECIGADTRRVSNGGQESLPGCWMLANYLLIGHGDVADLYMHLATRSLKVTVGEPVKRGQLVANAGTTGWSTANHLHFQVEPNPCAGACPAARCILKVAEQPTKDKKGVVGCGYNDGWWFRATTDVSQWRFGDPDVLAKTDKTHQTGLPQYLGVYTSGNEAPPTNMPVKVDWRNSTYTTNCQGVADRPFTVHLGNGEAHGQDASGRTYDLTLQAVTSGDSTGDNRPETAVLLACHPLNSNFTVQEIQIFTGDPDHRLGMLPQLKSLDNFPLPPVYDPERGFNISNGRLTTAMKFYTCADSHASGPSVSSEVSWTWNGSSFIAHGEPTGSSGANCTRHTDGSPSPLEGTWQNTNSSPRGTVRFVLSERGGVLTVHGFGACSPMPCDWGTVDGRTYAADVQSTEAVAFTADYDFGFADDLVAGYLSGDVLTLGQWTTFKDNSGRSSYYSVETFKKSGTTALSPPPQLAPADGTVFHVYPRLTTLSWQAVPGVTRYFVQVQACQPTSCEQGPQLAPLERTVDGTSFKFNFVGAQPGRWRVAAIDTSGERGPFSPWWGFTYLR